MPLETFTGPEVPELLARARESLGADAVLLTLRRSGAEFELVAADAATAGTLRPARPRRAAALPITRIPAAALESTAAPAPASAALPSPFAAALRRATGRAASVLALVGPTGAGKTTTLAKLAAHPRVFGGRAAGCLCLDTYRVGAIEQMKIYAELARLPLAVAYGLDDLERAMRRLRGCEVVLIDTPGRGPALRRDADATAAQLAWLAPDEIHLVLPAGLDPRHARRIVGEYRSRGVTHVLPTKCDECPGDRTPFALAAEAALPVRWYTDGQEVPSDLRAALAPAPNERLAGVA